MVLHNPRKKLFSCQSNLEQYKCLECITFQTHFLCLLKRHIREYHTEQHEHFQLHKCENCTFRTWSRYLIERHRNCGICKIFHIKHDHRYCKEHFDGLSWDNVECTTDHFTKSQKSLNLMHTAKWYECNNCSFKTKWKQCIVKHQEYKHSSVPREFKCKHCPFKTHHKHYLRRHQQYMHSSSSITRWFQCHNCSFKTRWKRYLVKHQEYKHSSVLREQFQCKYCSFKTRHKGYLTRHQELMHSDPTLIKWFECQYCLYKTKHKNSFELHQRMQHFRNSQEKLQCEDCSFETYYKQSLKTHRMRMHSNLIC